ncbi:MAG: NusA-like transcription termination signal-binding factor [archaeon]|nr:NusA-like transcription termination signal-binding factor [archaeon]
MKIGPAEIRFINALDTIAKVSARDCFVEENTIVFLVPEDKIRQAIGKNGVTIEKVRKTLGKNVELFEYTKEPQQFFLKAFYKANIEGVEIRKQKEKTIAVIKADNANKKIILRNLRRLGKIKELAKRNYEIDEVRIR